MVESWQSGLFWDREPESVSSFTLFISHLFFFPLFVGVLLFGLSPPLSPWLSVLCLRFYVCLSLSEDEVSICCRLVWVYVCILICTSVVHPVVWCRFQWPIVANGGLGCFDGHIDREQERKRARRQQKKEKRKNNCSFTKAHRQVLCGWDTWLAQQQQKAHDQPWLVHQNTDCICFLPVILKYFDDVTLKMCWKWKTRGIF